MNEQLLSRTECNAMRGLAIIGIFLHNYCHWLNPVVKENEYQYFQQNVDWMASSICTPDRLLPMHIFSYLGHYGVPIFLFLSAYGLVMKYEKKKAELPSSLSFIKYHYMKLFKMMIIGFVAFTMLDLITPGAHNYKFLDIVAMIGMSNNVLPKPDDIIWPGPYWFFGLMLQLYIVYKLFLCRRSSIIVLVFIAACVFGQLFFDAEGEAINRYRYNFMGGMLPFGLGVLYARYGHRMTMWGYASMFVMSSLLVCVLSCSFLGWTFVPAFVCTASIGLVKILNVSKFTSIKTSLVWMGSISAALFVCHPITRKIFIPISKNGDYYAGFLLYVITSICLAWLFNELIKRIPLK